MRSGKVESLLRKHLLPSLSRFAVKGRLLYATPLRYVLRGYYLEDSSFDANAFTVWAFAQPLYVPAQSLVFSLGRRLGTFEGGRELWWNISNGSEAEVLKAVLAQIQREGEPRFQGIDDPESLLMEIEGLSGGERDLYALETVAYSCVLIGDRSRAMDALTTLDNTLEGMNIAISWIAEAGERSRRIRTALLRGVDAAREILDQWTEETAWIIGLPRDRP